jgi:hypothetical protein
MMMIRRGRSWTGRRWWRRRRRAACASSAWPRRPTGDATSASSTSTRYSTISDKYNVPHTKRTRTLRMCNLCAIHKFVSRAWPKRLQGTHTHTPNMTRVTDLFSSPPPPLQERGAPVQGKVCVHLRSFYPSRRAGFDCRQCSYSSLAVSLFNDVFLLFALAGGLEQGVRVLLLRLLRQPAQGRQTNLSFSLYIYAHIRTPMSWLVPE